MGHTLRRSRANKYDDIILKSASNLLVILKILSDFCERDF